jgi:ABC-type nickel/cobalt efflux system permease component RcnA
MRRFLLPLFALAALVAAGPARAHPLGNFTINHYARLRVAPERLDLRYVVDMAEIPAFQALQEADRNQDGTASPEEREAYADRAAPEYAAGLVVQVDGRRLPLHLQRRSLTTPPGAGGLPTLRLECDFTAPLPSGAGSRRLRFVDENQAGRIGWREVVVQPAGEAAVWDSTAFGSGVTDEIRAYPADLLTSPLAEQSAEFTYGRGAVPPGAAALRTRDGRPVAQARDRFAELIAVPRITPLVALLGLLLAFLLGAMHALSPGHGKTIVGAYLVGARGTARHAAFLGLTVTLTHTAGVFALGLVTLFASRYVLPERLFPVLSFISGALVVAIGASLLVRRLQAAGLVSWRVGELEGRELTNSPTRQLAHDHAHDHEHGPHGHDHLPPGADGAPVIWRSLLLLGISGGLLPCPSALVVMLSAIALHRVAYGLLLVTAFSLGLAAALTGIGLAFLYAGRLVERPARLQPLLRVLPVGGAFVVTLAGLAICLQALAQAGWVSFGGGGASAAAMAAALPVLGVGLVFGLKHAFEADHMAAVTTIVSERKNVFSSALVGGLWGIGHTLSLLVAGVAVILLHLKIGRRLEMSLEFCVALMLIGLGVNAFRKLRSGAVLHAHAHRHGERLHIHPHLHTQGEATDVHTHHGFRLGTRPLLVGMVHGMAGSAALMLLVLTTIPSPAVGFAYIGVFGIGSIGGMMLMSALVGLPVHLTAARFTQANVTLRALAGAFSLLLGFYKAYETGFIDGLFR